MISSRAVPASPGAPHGRAVLADAAGRAGAVGAGQGEERRSSAPDFEVAGVVFACFCSIDGQRFVWRSADRRLEVSAGEIRFPTDEERETGVRPIRFFRAVVDGVEVKSSCVSIRAAMDAAVWAMRRGE